MNSTPPVVSPFDSVSKAIDMLVSQNIGAVVTVEDRKPVGIITERDILERVLIPERDLETTLVRDVMSTPLITVESSLSIKDALKQLRENNIRRLVVTEESYLVGLTTERRLLEAAHSSYLMRIREGKNKAIYTSIEKPNVSFLSSFPPRECGIATYTSDLVDSISRLQVLGPPIITAVNDKGGYYDYPSSVKLQIEREEIDSYKEAAKRINASGIDVVNLQHEFGLFGGVWGEYLIEFLENLNKPVITTLHTVFQEPTHDAGRVMKEIIELSRYVVVMARVGIKILEQLYDTFADKVRYIPHGCPNVPSVRSKTLKESMGLGDRVLLSTFGLISRGKGIEYAIGALPDIVEKEPRVLYLVIGETHPEVRKQEGESYRQSLYELVDELGVEENVRFVNRFLEKNDLIRLLQATDVYVIPYPNREQISSGTLLYALSTGKAIVSTPFLHAEEVISHGAAMSCRFKDPESIAECVNNLIRYDQLRNDYEARAYEYSRDMIWPNVAMKYVNLFYETIGL
jgi:glycosyltransferase involved in cell wall biosynthesis/CBS domain-containing protein